MAFQSGLQGFPLDTLEVVRFGKRNPLVGLQRKVREVSVKFNEFYQKGTVSEENDVGSETRYMRRKNSLSQKRISQACQCLTSI